MIALILAAALSTSSTPPLLCQGLPKLGTATARDDRSPRLYDAAGNSLGQRTWSDLKIKTGEKVPVFGITTRELIVIANRKAADGSCLYVNRGAFQFACSCRTQSQEAAPVSSPTNIQPSGSRQSGLQLCPVENRVNCPK